MRSSTHRDIARINNENFKKVILDNKKSKIKNPLLNRTTNANFKLDSKTVNQTQYKSFDVNLHHYNAPIIKNNLSCNEPMLIKDSSNVMNYPN